MRRFANRYALRGLLLALLLAAFAQMLVTARLTSQTVDEGLHVTSGATILRSGDYRLVEEHPPLVKLWLALPLLPLRDLGDFTTLPAWQEAAAPTPESLPLLTLTQRWLYPYRPQERITFPVRTMNALLCVLLLALVARWSRERFGARAGLLALACAAFDPNLLAHGAVAGTDVGAALFTFAGLWTGSRFLERPTRGRALAAGGVLGLALAAKLTAVLLGPALLAAGLVRLWRAPRAARKALVAHALLLLAATGITLWAVYGFEIGPLPGTGVPVPAPSHAIPWMRLLAHSGGGHQAYLLGRNSLFGWPHYFPVAFALKTPLPTLLLLGWALLRRPWEKPVRLALPLFVLTYAAASIAGSLNIGYRHLLPILPPLYVLAGSLAARRPLPPARAASLAALWLWLALGTLAVIPYPLSYFNALAGGPREGWRYLADSNTDWGQGYKALAAFQEEHEIGPVQLSAFVFYDPATYGVAYTPLTPLGGDTPPVFPARFAPPPGDYVISATPLDGIPTVDPEMYDWFRWRAPDAQVAHALFYYRVTPEEVATGWLAQCTTVALPLDQEAIVAGFGAVPPRQLHFDCAESWVLPGAGDPGVYALHGQLLDENLAVRLHRSPPQPTDPFIRRHLAPTEIAYRQRAYRDRPAFALYRAEERPAPPAPSLWAAPARTAPAALRSQPPETGARHLEGPLTFLGAAAYGAGAQLEVETWWRVTGSTGGRPPSIMAHLLREDGVVVGNADGMGFPPEQWREGDVVVQRHRFVLPEPPAGPLTLRTGVYWLDDGSRWPVDGDRDALFVPLAIP